jgi:integrase
VSVEGSGHRDGVDNHREIEARPGHRSQPERLRPGKTNIFLGGSSKKMRGKQPYWMSRIMQHHIKPVAAKTGIEIKGWHTLRHSYTTLLRQNNNNPKVVQGLLRHASYSITMNVYDEAMSEEKRNAHRGVIQQLNRSVTRSAPKPAIPQIVDKDGVPDGI